ncbi:hypothetical protein B0T16DRAFT_230239 [Cercophora newfieldiana]|uniref:Uncharacterized protein n=1 Tax=Cercophora newfieldiana TaxID=92897 RepID=A0AA40CIU3_9PEZI|nr:hypothetical protein B0T16DRAFT_230239 [Cercophora newfieldiana]
MDGSMPWISRCEASGHNISRPATSPADIESQPHTSEFTMSTRRTSPELTNHNNLSGRLGMGLRETSAQTERLKRYDANASANMALAMAERAVMSPGAGSSSPYSSMSPVLHSNPRSSTSNASSPRSVSGASLPVYYHSPGSGTPVAAGEIPEGTGPAFRLGDDIIGGCAPSPTAASSPVATRPCAFYHAVPPLLPHSSSSSSAHRGQQSSPFKYSEGTSSPNHLRRYHQASSSSPASCGTFSSFNRTSLTSPRDRSSTMSAASYSRSPPAAAMPTGDNISGPQGNNNDDTTGLPVDKGKGKDVETTLPASSRGVPAALPATLSSSQGVRKYSKAPASSSGSSTDLAERYLPGKLTPGLLFWGYCLHFLGHVPAF